MRKLSFEMVEKRAWPKMVAVLIYPYYFESNYCPLRQYCASNEQVSAKNNDIDLKYQFVNAAIGSGTMFLKYLNFSANL